MFSPKALRITFQFGVNEFAPGKNTKIIEGLACLFNIEQVAAPDFCKCSGKIFGMGLEDMARLTTLAFDPLLIDKRNLILIEAGENGEYSTVFYGEVETSFADFTLAPNISLSINAMSGSYAMKLPTPAISINGTATVKDVINNLATQAGYTLECNVTKSVSNAVFQGSIMQQIYAVAQSVNAKVVIDNNILRVMPIKDALKGSITVISKDSGLIGYPTFTNMGVTFDMVYNPQIKQQSVIELQSIVPKATGSWRVIKLNHSLSAFNPDGGDWKTNVEAVYV